jgi:hypothetical protein
VAVAAVLEYMDKVVTVRQEHRTVVLRGLTVAAAGQVDVPAVLPTGQVVEVAVLAVAVAQPMRQPRAAIHMVVVVAAYLILIIMQ